ncbi:ferric reductase-like transmembrane domain-containing protein [Oricola cellulosilytica]|uniref:Ferric oxidoreductase domain-containing protein n=1 Tax=Oricola cellulosilytica TaxID=1429082 RepID=A0A4R0PBD6_9HYPH|nr:ferric reductase-like transmembrane domain-containing protein [Oricola cellulosilytica]TCD14366.1 hypothetical protein E0D97_09855 [Oricola cellulosilytica]
MIPRKWIGRHLAVLAISAFGVAFFYFSRSDWSPMHRWNRSIGDMSLLLVAMAMALGPLSRLWRPSVRVMAYRRELGIYAVVLAFIHATIILFGWVELDLMRLIGFEYHPALERYVMLQHGFAFANLVGVVALIYGLVLALTSNDLSVRWLSEGVWKFVQRGTYVLWWLSVLHTGYFLFLHFLDFHRPTPAPNWAQWPFVFLVLAVLALQASASAATWRRVRRRGAPVTT